MRVRSNTSNEPVELGLIVEFSVDHSSLLKGKFRNEFYMNDSGQIIWDLFHISRSTIEPVSTIVYNVVKE